MGGAHEIAEKIEHMAHEGGGGHGHDASGKYIGLTMAVLGVMLAICSAMVGAERTELIQTMVEQSNVYDEYQAVSTKYRVQMGAMQQLYAQTPSRHLTDEALERLDKLPVPAEQQAAAALQKASLKEMMMLLQPRKSEVEGFLATVDRYDNERKAARAWADAYDEQVHAHFEGSEQFEKAQLLAEIGIVIASIALLLHSKKFWYVSLGAAGLCVVLLGVTWTKTHNLVHENEHKIEQVKEHYEELRGKKDASGKRMADVRDEQLLEKVHERFGVAAVAAGAEHGEHAAPPAGEHAAPHH